METFINMTQEGLSSNNEGQFLYQARYSRIELKELGRTVLVQYYVCSSNIPCVRVLGYIQEGSVARVSGGQEFEDEMHLLANLKPIPEQHKWAIRLCVMANIAASLSIDPQLVQFLAAKKIWANRTIADDPLQILIPCSICHESEASIFQTDGEYCLYCWQEITHPKI